jgi:hypothetical protein
MASIHQELHFICDAQDASTPNENLQPTNNNKKSNLNNQTFIDLQC